MLSKELVSDNINLDLSNLSRGMYYLKFKTDRGAYTISIMKE